MDNTINAKRNSSLSGKESSSPSDPFDNIIEKEPEGSYEEESSLAKVLSYSYNEGATNLYNALPHLHSKSDFHMKVPHEEKFKLCALLILNNIVSKQYSANIYNRLKQKIRPVVYFTTAGKIRYARDETIKKLYLTVSQEDVKLGHISANTIDSLMSGLCSVSVKDRGQRQKDKLKQKVIALMLKNGLTVESQENRDSHSKLRTALLSLSPEDRLQLLTSVTH